MARRISRSISIRRAPRYSTASQAENVGRKLAIVLDGVVYSDPVIKERIPNGTAVIEGSYTDEEAKVLAIALRTGRLPAPVKILEQRTVGPALGADSIKEWNPGLGYRRTGHYPVHDRLLQVSRE